MFKKVAKDTSLLSLGTAVSLFLGFIRNILIAAFFGTSVVLEAFIVAFRLPNLFRSIAGEGFSDSVATPVLSEYQGQRARLFDSGANMLSFSALVLLIASVLGTIFAKFLVMLIAPGFLAEPSKFVMAVSFTRITFLYLFFVGLSVNSFSILYVLKKFFIPSVTPAFLNISFIVGLLFFSRFFKNYILVICVLSGGVLQLVFPFISLKREGFVFRFRIKGLLQDTALRRMLQLSPPRFISSLVYQLSVILDTILASFTSVVGAGALAALWFANTYIHLPLALFIHSICRVATVDLSYYHSRDNLADFKKLLVFSFQNIVFFILPIAVMYLFLPQAIIDVVLRRENFGQHSSALTTSALFFYSFGLFFFCGIKLLVTAFYALKDTLVPAKVTAASLLINAALSAALMFPLKIGGVALGSSLAAMFNFFILYRILRKKIGAVDWQDTRSQFLKVLSLSLVAAGLSRLSWDLLALSKYLKALIIVAASAAVFIGGGRILGLKQIAYARQWISGKK